VAAAAAVVEVEVAVVAAVAAAAPVPILPSPSMPPPSAVMRRGARGACTPSWKANLVIGLATLGLGSGLGLGR